MRALRVLLALCGTCAVLVGGALLGGARAEAPSRAPRQTDSLSYSTDGEIPIGDSLEVNGQPMQLSVFYTQDTPKRVEEFYAGAFAARGVTPILGDDERMGFVAGFDPKDGLQRFISALPQPDGQTLVMVGVTNPRKPPRFTHGAEEAGFPVPPENRAYLGYKSNDAGAAAESGQFVTSLTPADVLAYYRAELPKRGWTERKGDSAGSLAAFGKEGEILSVAVQALDETKGAAVFVNRTSSGEHR